ncbi:J domain-containing protein [Tepidibacter mesophilus]|uniref:J domain-containing protein n=1 Tax=Tepidibacter mesophilus TaxID=655607 RepID=UPI000C078245|nr:J domain-containing protein [Tepidibacter mesophilus]
MNWWEILDIPYDSDLKTIKKAYAKLLKIYNPEDDPEGYQRLRETYDTAIKYVKNNKQQDLHIGLVENINDEVSIVEDKANIDKKIIERQYQNINNSYDQHTSNDVNLQIEEFLDRLNELYNDNSLKSDINAWEKLLNNNVVWNVSSSLIIEDYIFEFLLNHEDLPLNIWYILNYHFNWTNKERMLYEKYDEQSVEKVLKILQNIGQIKYEYIKEIDPNFIEKYLSLYSQGCEALKTRDYYQAQESLLEAYKIFNHDEELLKILGQFYYQFRDLEKSLEFFELAFKIDSFDLRMNLFIGSILTNMGRYSEALPYIEPYLASAPDNELALNNIGYCYYFTDNLVKARERFKRLIELQPNNRVIKKYLSNIEAKLEGNNVKTLKVRKYNPRMKKAIKKKKVIKKKKQKPRTEASMEKARFKLIIIYLIAAVIAFKLSFMFQSPDNNNDTKKSIEFQNDNKNELLNEDETVFKTIRTMEDLRKVDYYINVRLYLDEVKPTKYFKISEEFNGKNILSKKEIEDNKLQEKIESRIYVGIFDTGFILFADKNYALNKKIKYKLEGAICAIDSNTYENIKTQNKNYKFGEHGIYIDCSQKEVERLKKHNESLEVHNGTRIKVVKTLKELEESNSVLLHHIYLKNIIPLNIYVYVDENGKFDFRKKEELNEKNSKNKTYTKAFVGQLEGKNIMFIDNNFSMNNADSNMEYTIEGYPYRFTVEEVIHLPTEKGQNVDSVEIESHFIYNPN